MGRVPEAEFLVNRRPVSILPDRPNQYTRYTNHSSHTLPGTASLNQTVGTFDLIGCSGYTSDSSNSIVISSVRMALTLTVGQISTFRATGKRRWDGKHAGRGLEPLTVSQAAGILSCSSAPFGYAWGLDRGLKPKTIQGRFIKRGLNATIADLSEPKPAG